MSSFYLSRKLKHSKPEDLSLVPSLPLALTPFYTPQIVLDAPVIEQPEIPFTPYSLFAYESKLFPKVYKHVKQKFLYPSLVQEPVKGNMVFALKLYDDKGYEVKPTYETMDTLMNIISENNLKYPDYALLIQADDIPIFRPWVKIMLPHISYQGPKSLPSDEELYFNTIIEDDNVFIDMRDVVDYYEMTKALLIEFQKNIRSLFINGYLSYPPDLSESLVQKISDKLCFIDTDTILDGENSFEKLSNLPITILPNTSDIKVISDLEFKDIYDCYTFNFSDVIGYIPGSDPFNNYMGASILYSLKTFLQADKIITVYDGLTETYKISLYDEEGKVILSSINIEDLRGYKYFSSSPAALLALASGNQSDIMKLIHDKVSGRVGIFLPIEVDGQMPFNDTNFGLLTENLIKSKHIFLNLEDEDNTLIKLDRFGIDYEQVEVTIDNQTLNYLFVEKHPLITDKAILRSSGLDGFRIFLDGPWQNKVSKDKTLDKGIEIYNSIKITDFKPFIQKGVYETFFGDFYSPEHIQKFTVNLSNTLHLNKNKYKYEGVYG